MDATLNVSDREQSAKRLTTIIYALYAGGLLTGGLTALVAIIMNYVKRDEVRGTWLESHVEWQIKTFWLSLAGYVVGFITTFILIGFVILLIRFIWNMYRLIVGLIALTENRPVG